MDWSSCPCANPVAGAKPNGTVRTVDSTRVVSLLTQCEEALLRARHGQGDVVGMDKTSVSSIHVTAGGDALVSSSATAGNRGDVVLRGTIAAFPCDLHVRLGLAGPLVGVNLMVSQPFILGPIAWRFELLGPDFDTARNIVSASAVAAAISDAPAAAKSASAMVRDSHLGAWRFLNRVGNQVLPTLTRCLPALAAGADAFVACAVARIGAHDAPRIAEHLIGNELTETRRAI